MVTFFLFAFFFFVGNLAQESRGTQEDSKGNEIISAYTTFAGQFLHILSTEYNVKVTMTLKSPKFDHYSLTGGTYHAGDKADGNINNLRCPFPISVKSGTKEWNTLSFDINYCSSGQVQVPAMILTCNNQGGPCTFDWTIKLELFYWGAPSNTPIISTMPVISQPPGPTPSCVMNEAIYYQEYANCAESDQVAGTQRDKAQNCIQKPSCMFCNYTRPQNNPLTQSCTSGYPTVPTGQCYTMTPPKCPYDVRICGINYNNVLGYSFGVCPFGGIRVYSVPNVNTQPSYNPPPTSSYYNPPPTTTGQPPAQIRAEDSSTTSSSNKKFPIIAVACGAGGGLLLIIVTVVIIIKVRSKKPEPPQLTSIQNTKA